MRSSYIIYLLMILVVTGTYWYKATAAICPAPLSYRIGEIDDSFGISLSDAIKYAEEAESVWEDSIDRELFVYNDTADFTIDFVFDERQEMANTEAALRDTLDDQRLENDLVLSTVKTLQSKYEALSSTYENRAAEYERLLQEYNKQVGKYNDRGGAPPKVFEGLEEERVSLNGEAEELTSLSDNLNKLAREINNFSDKGNKLVDLYNKEVSKYNNEFGFSREFTQGDHQGSQIRIYKFSTDNELVTVLAHEFGHALGVNHVEGESSLMYYLLGDTSTVRPLSGEDMSEYLAVCGIEESNVQEVRRLIREFLADFK